MPTYRPNHLLAYRSCRTHTYVQRLCEHGYGRAFAVVIYEVVIVAAVVAVVFDCK